MKHALIVALGVAASMLPGPSAFAAASAEGELPTRWQVNGNGTTGTLEFKVDDEGALTGQLLGEQIEGFVSGRHLFIRRTADGRIEIWEGWLAQPRQVDDAKSPADRNMIVAGSISVSEAGQTRVYPWFGRTETSPAASSSASPGGSVAPVTDDVPPSSADGGLSGTWSAGKDGRMGIDQQDNRLTVTLPDGSSHSGRMTGSSTFVVGLRKGCCSGTLETEDVIVWSDGVRWERTD